MKLIIRWFISALAIAVTAYLLPGVQINGLMAALVLAVVLGAINAILRPILVILTLPITIFTLGLFVLVINASLVLLAAAIVPGVVVDNFLSAFLFGIILAVVNWVLRKFENEN